MPPRASASQNATTTTAIGPAPTHTASPRGRIFISANRQATVTSRVYRQRWQAAEHIEDFKMLAKVRRLPPTERAEHAEFLDTLVDQAEHRRLVREAFEISKRSLARFWGPDDAESSEQKT